MKTYFTDYIEPDQTAINLRYVNGIIIPSGYYYIGKTSDNNENIVISEKQDDTVDISNENQYVWTKQSSKIESTPEDIKLKSNQEEYQFVASVNTYKGYFKNKNGNVQYVVIDEGKWSEAYTKQMEYEDKNRIKNDIDYSTNHCCHHADLRKSLCRNKWIHSHHDQNKNTSKNINPCIIHAIRKCLIASTKHRQ